MSVFVGKETFKYGEFQREFRKWVSSKGNNSHKLLSDGIPCEFITTTGKDWTKGKIRIRLEFIPDNAVQALEKLESPSLIEYADRLEMELAELRLKLDQ